MQEGLVERGCQLDPHSYKTVLAAVELDGCVEWGLYPRHLHYQQQPDEPSRLPAGCSHAVGKLAEAVDAVGWDMSKVKVAVDLGRAHSCLHVFRLFMWHPHQEGLASCLLQSLDRSDEPLTWSFNCILAALLAVWMEV